MPFTPFIGLSVFVHLVIILWHKIFDKTISVKSLIAYKSASFVHAIVTLIVVFVFTAVAATAGALVRASYFDKYSSINLTEQFVGRAEKTFYHSEATSPPVNKMFLTTALASSVTSNQSSYICIRSQEPVSNYNNSIVNYLISKKQNSSFEARIGLAASYGIKSYEGSSPQNLLLLKQMVSSELCQS